MESFVVIDVETTGLAPSLNHRVAFAMKKSLKAALLSALVFPGCGHLLLKKYMRGVLLAGISIVCAYFVLTMSMQMAEHVAAQIQSGQIALDASAISDAVEKAKQSSARAWGTDLATYLLGICWLTGVIDAYRVGRQLEKLNA